MYKDLNFATLSFDQVRSEIYDNLVDNFTSVAFLEYWEEIQIDLKMEKLLKMYPKILLEQIQELLLNGGSGISCLHMGFNPPLEKFESLDEIRHNSFILDVPYAGKHLKWNVMFNDDDFGFGPDFDFLNDDFLNDPDEDIIDTDIPSLRDWNVNDPKCLSRVVKEFLALYKKYQVEKLNDNKFQRHLMEYTLLTGDIGIAEEDIEVLIESKDTIHFYIMIRVPLYTLPPYCKSDKVDSEFFVNPGEDAAILRVRFGTNDVFPNLQFSPRLENLVGSSKDLHIPQYCKDSGLVEYVPAITELINDRLESISKSFIARNDFISALIAYKGHALLEYDSILFSKAAILQEYNNVLVYVLICLDNNFPLQKPELMISPMTTGNDALENVSKFAYQSKWKETRMLKEIFLYLEKISARFLST